MKFYIVLVIKSWIFIKQDYYRLIYEKYVALFVLLYKFNVDKIIV